MSKNVSDLGHPVDPYKAANLDDPNLQEKVEDLIAFIEKCKFCMMATRVAGSDLIASRCMALAGKVRVFSSRGY
jgi:hypothetical protein